MATDVSKMSASELDKLSAKIEKRRQELTRRDALSQMEAIAKKHGVDFAEVVRLHSAKLPNTRKTGTRKAAPKAKVKPAAKSTSKTTRKVAPKMASKTAAKAVKKPVAKTAGKTVAKTVSKPAAKAAGKTAAKTVSKPAAKAAGKTAAKTVRKPAAKAAGKTVAKTASKPAAKAARKPAAKTVSKPAVKADPKLAAISKVVSKPKYKNPDNPKQTWTGNGRKPAWFIAQLEAGRKPEGLSA